MANKKNVFSYAILGFDGGKSLKMADCPIHFSINDMHSRIENFSKIKPLIDMFESVF